ncbi:hypothetical protein K491DRAFT_690496 [Lophiostoma macrostomum CBS 122681]|uniref:ASST-domain-containing protein n=1 Tax=Lophiostoma macrostomum CBS 122681 TaxID=1314788 RepID=A0A6A6TDS4_9PLEO|nr:hypothetical protein K491DRAFT_690496 [Lophiostoma macrostomum CBS 122681]
MTFFKLCRAVFNPSIVAFFLTTPTTAIVDEKTSPTSFFRSRPDLHAPIVELEIFKPELVSPGYVFLAPYRNIDPGLYIYDNSGQLIWSGAGTQGSSTVHNPHVCQYGGQDHLCFFQGHQHHGWARGHGVIMDNRYRVVQTVEAVGSAPTIDMHEFRLVNDGKSALVTIYQPRAYDLSGFGIGPGVGWIQDSLFQEIDVDSGELIFEWRALDHIAPSFSYTCVDCTDTSGDGLTRDTPWDFFHINSIDKNAAGDYLISARHAAGVYKISGQDGRVLWQLNGANPTFKNKHLHFSSQHHATWVDETEDQTVISLFDNASNTFNITNRESRGMLIGIDHIKRTATKIRTWQAPEKNGILAGSQGNVQLLPNGNAFIGWGDHAFYSEHLISGEPVLYGKLAYWGSDVMMYRCNKHPWVANPLTTPTLWTYSLTGTNDSTLVSYVSWNGATEVHHWLFYTADSATGPFQLAGSKNRTGFETEFDDPRVKQWSFAEAVDKSGRSLKRSSVVKTFVPSNSIVSECGLRNCGPVPPLEEGEVFDKNMPLEPNRGRNYTRGYSTGRYYPNDSTFGRISYPSKALHLGIFLVILAAVFLLVGKRKLLGSIALCQGRCLGAYSREESFPSVPTYQKLEDADRGT